MSCGIKNVGVVGAGQMGGGIAQVFAEAGFDVHLFDVAESSLEKTRAVMSKSLSKLAEKGKLQGDVETILKRLSTTTNLSDLATCQFVVEAVPENVQLKLKLFAELDSLLSSSAIIASNTSSISIDKLASATKRVPQIIGMHFMNPVPLMPCVEVIRAPKTSEQTFEITKDLIEDHLNKSMVVSTDKAGFIVNRILMPMINEAANALHEGVANREDIDAAMKLSCNFPMGPLTLADFIGLDTCVAILEVMQEGLSNIHYAPSPALVKLVQAGRTGRKVGHGFYDYK